MNYFMESITRWPYLVIGKIEMVGIVVKLLKIVCIILVWLRSLIMVFVPSRDAIGNKVL